MLSDPPDPLSEELFFREIAQVFRDSAQNFNNVVNHLYLNVGVGGTGILCVLMFLLLAVLFFVGTPWQFLCVFFASLLALDVCGWLIGVVGERKNNLIEEELDWGWELDWQAVSLIDRWGKFQWKLSLYKLSFYFLSLWLSCFIKSSVLVSVFDACKCAQ